MESTRSAHTPKQGKTDSKALAILQDFYKSYMEASRHSGLKEEERNGLFNQLLSLVTKNIQHPHKFSIFHQSVHTPFDYYQFSLNFIRSMIDFNHSQVNGTSHIDRIIKQLANKENVILLANHQTEPDPQIINLLLEKDYPVFASQMIFVAGHRVIEDPIAIPMSLGCNLLCIYSKKHIDTPPEDKPKKVSHNQRTMKKMSELLNEGGKCIYVAPSGGRDRRNSAGKVEVSPFDPQSIEMFWLMSQRATNRTHFYPMALLTHDLLPPPQHVEKELGERREAFYNPVYIAFGSEIDMEKSPGIEAADKKEKRNHRAKHIWNLVHDEYIHLVDLKNKAANGQK